MPSLNVAPYIKACIESVRNQTIDDMEILCVDAGSTDGTLEILREYEQTDSRIQVIISDKKSYGFQVNLGIRVASGKYIAIVESDDLINDQMYEQLYQIAESHNCDYVKADYDYFIEQNDGRIFSEKVALFMDTPEFYNRVIDPSHNNYIYTNDMNVWKGIYKRDFLMSNNIWFQETPGAAFQDLGFSMKVFYYARCAYYSDQSYYQYRMGRETASIQSPKGLIYLYQEFRRLLEDEAVSHGMFLEGIYNRMANAFYVEFLKVLKIEKFDLESEFIAPVFAWFVETFVDAKEKGIWPNQSTNYFICNKVEDALYHTDEFVRSQKKYCEKESEKERELLSFAKRTSGSSIIIFGAGKLGTYVHKILFTYGYDIYAFADNHTHLEKKCLHGKQILSAENAISLAKYKRAYFIVANKKNYNEIYAQLIEMGIEQPDILIYGEK